MGQAKRRFEQNQKGWGVYIIGDCEWWIAESAEQAVIHATFEYQWKPEDVPTEEVRKLTEDELIKSEYHCMQSDRVTTFKEEFDRRCRMVLDCPDIFAQEL